MWNRSRVKAGSLQALAVLNRLSRRYEIDKIQRLSANFERACWRSVRCAEEGAYHRKYAFLRHCVDVINHRKAQRKIRSIPLDNIASRLASQFNGTNHSYIQKQVGIHLNRLSSALPSCLTQSDVTADKAKPQDILQKCKSNEVDSATAEKAVCVITEMVKLRRLQERLSSMAPNADTQRGYKRHRLESMALRFLPRL
ncbi:hypothetical protein BaOVIS_010030 [Babesia ovis]|uniref:Uncharacterized protein n=1 Tax=Babesia ovis TaxID=5869 RepID=A0A9W5T8W2_BABOV|nr:hypothetical protein BaOVIS_010030 [Babesia ovis]